MGIFEDPSGGGCGIAVRHLQNMVAVVKVTGYDPNATYNGELKPSVTFDALIVTPGNMVFGGNIPEGKPDDQQVKTPYFASGIIASNVNIVRPLAAKAGTGKLTIGRFCKGQGTKGNPPWNFEALKPTAEDMALRSQAEILWTQLMSGSFVNPIPTPFGTPSFAESDPWASPPGIPEKTLDDQWPDAPVDSGPECPATVNPTVWANMDAGTRATVLAAIPAQAAAVVKPAPPGVDPAKWAAMNENERRAVAAALGGSY